MTETHAERALRLERATRVAIAQVSEDEHPWVTTFALLLANALAPAANDNQRPDA